jgi:large subunit ribosomal protein L16
MLFPKKVKYRKWQRQRKNPLKVTSATRGTHLAFGSFGMKAVTPARVRSNQIEAARKVLARHMGKTGRTWIRVFPDRPWTQKAAEVGMGKGKGDVQGFEFEVLPGRLLFEVDGIPEKVAVEALIQAASKLPLKIKIVSRVNA